MFESCSFIPMSDSHIECVVEIEQMANKHPWSLGVFRDCLSGTYENWVALVEGNIVGFGIVTAAVEEAHLLNICIHPHYQGKGLGKTLLHFLVERAIALEGKNFFLEVRESNVRAQKLYLQSGFAQVGLRKNYYPLDDGRENAVVMSLSLNQDIVV